jgi:hypothetical protein
MNMIKNGFKKMKKKCFKSNVDHFLINFFLDLTHLRPEIFVSSGFS